MPPPDRRASDTSRSYAALCDYAALGPARSIDKLLQMYHSTVTETPPPTRHRGTIGLWSSTHDWQNRVAAYDQAIATADEAARGAIRAARRIELENADWESGEALRQAAHAILLEMPRFIRGNTQRVERDGLLTEIITVALKAGPGEIARAMELASKLQRLSVGEATEIHRLVETELGAMLDRIESQLTPEEFARVVSAIASSAPAGE